MNEDTPKSESISPSIMPRLKELVVIPIDDVLTVLKLVYVISIAIGFFLVWSFTTQSLIPFQLDISSVLFLFAVTALALFSFSMAVGIALTPMMLITVFPRLLPPLESRAWRGFSRHFVRYGVVFLPYLVFALSFPFVIWVLSLVLDNTNQSFVTPIALLLSVVFSLLASFANSSRIASFRSLAVSFMSLVWMAAMIVIAVPIAIRMRGIIPPGPSDWLVFIFILVVIGWHLMVVTIALSFDASWKGWVSVAAVALGVIFLIPRMQPASPSLGAVTFRLMGIGGGIPISAIVRLVDISSGELKIRRMQGCLVLSFGNQISIQSSSDAGQQIHCHLSPLTPVVEKGVIVPTAVHTLLRSDVLDIYSIGTPPKR